MPGCARCARTNRTISKCRNLARASVDQRRPMVRADFPSLQLHSFLMTKTTRDKCKTIQRCHRDLSSYSYTRSECSGLPGCWSGQTLKAGHVSHYGGGGEVERWGREKKKKETLNEFPSLVKRRSRGVALCDDKQIHALCLSFLVCSQATARPVASASYAAPMCVLNLCSAAYYQWFITQISWGHEVRKHVATSHFLQHIFKTWG